MNLPIASQIWILILLVAQARRPPAAAGPAFRISVSGSPFTETLFKAGFTFTDGKMTDRTPEGLQRLYMAYGANEVYAQIATARSHNRGFGDHSLSKGLERARLAKALDLEFNPELGLFGDYGDIRCQPAPDPSLEKMLPLLRS